MLSKSFEALLSAFHHVPLQEFDNDAETLIGGVSASTEDDEAERTLKLAHIDMYNKRLREREQRKK